MFELYQIRVPSRHTLPKDEMTTSMHITWIPSCTNGNVLLLIIAETVEYLTWKATGYKASMPDVSKHIPAHHITCGEKTVLT